LLADPWSVVAGFFAAQALYFDHLGAHAGQHLGTPWTGLVPSQVKHSNITQWMLHFDHSYGSPFGSIAPFYVRLD